MRIHGLTVCVDYADLFAIGIERLMSGLASLTVVTRHGDEETADLAMLHGAAVFQTDAFYLDGAAFNKGRAMEEARLRMPWEDWILFVDADIVPPVGWADIVYALKPRSGILYSAWRHQCDDPNDLDRTWPMIRGDGIGVGYWQLFHADDPAVYTGANPSLIETHWLHAGNYDNGFMHRWPRGRRKIIPGLELLHLGTRDNWWGRGNRKAFDAMIVERERRGGKWGHERIGSDV